MDVVYGPNHAGVHVTERQADAQSELSEAGVGAAVKAAGLEPLRIHDMRRTCASILINSSEQPKRVQDHLGHSSIQVTYDLYGHLWPDAADSVADHLAVAFESGAVATQR